MNNIKKSLKNFEFKFKYSFSRYIISDFDQSKTVEIINQVKKVFGIHSLSVAKRVESSMQNIFEAAKLLSKPVGTFRVNTNRADKNFTLNSMQVSREIGGMLLNHFQGLKVDLHKPDFVVNIDIRENGVSYLFSDAILGAGGLPVNTAGLATVMISGGIDSPVAAYMMAKRGLRLNAVHFHSYPYTSELAKQKVMDLLKIVSNYSLDVPLFVVPFTKIQESINKYCRNNYMIILMRRFMVKITEAIAIKSKSGAIITGESLAQVASQTIESLHATNSVATLPIFRPLIGMDKSEIIEISQKIGTFETSILPYEDCCTVFLPDSPVIHPKIDRILEEEAKIPDYDELIADAIAATERIVISH